jgi:Tol biopolymer transport system component/DNA-binding winged helix-turn-helix (wHTH) protein
MTREPTRGQNLVQFGIFEVNLSWGELRKSGRKIKLQVQPFKVLVALLEQPGELVTREELRRRIWPEQSFGDFDHAVNLVITKLRAALGDSADAPRFIETLHRRGYRFIFPVTVTDSGIEKPPNVAVTESLETKAEEPATESPKSDSDPGSLGKSKRRRQRWLWIAAPIVTAAGVIAAIFFWPNSAPRVNGSTQITHDSLDILNVISDGFRLYITESTGSRQFLMQISAAGGESSVIPTPFASIAISAVSPDHSKMLLVDAVGTDSKSQLWVLPLPAGAPQRLADIEARWNLWAAGWAAWSPDGRHIVFADDSAIQIANADGTQIHNLVHISGAAEQMQFSPDGARLRFSVKNPQSEVQSLWEVGSDGTNLHLLFPDKLDGLSDLGGYWSRDGKYYFFTRCDKNGCNVWCKRESWRLFHSQASALTQLTISPAPVFLNGLNADGKGIFVSEWNSRSELVRYDEESRQFVPFLPELSADDVDFSRDGIWATYVSGTDRGLWRSRLDGTERRQLTSSGPASMPRWSPDGKQIAYVEQRGTWSRIFVIAAEGGAPRGIYSENRNQLDPSWSPDGRQIAFGKAPWANGDKENINIQIVNLESGQSSVVPGSENLFSARWSPDGKYLAATSSDSKTLMLFDFNTQKWTELIHESGAVIYPSWSADSTYVYFDNISLQDPGYRRVRIGQKRSELVVDLKNLRRGIGSHVGPWSGITPDSSPLFQRDLSTGEVHLLELTLP